MQFHIENFYNVTITTFVQTFFIAIKPRILVFRKYTKRSRKKFIVLRL